MTNIVVAIAIALVCFSCANTDVYSDYNENILDRFSRTEPLEPGDLALVLNEEEFEDYLDEWLKIQQDRLYLSRKNVYQETGCTINVNGDLGNPQPVYIRNNAYVTPSGNSGAVRLDTGDKIIIACPGSGRTIAHPKVLKKIATANATCSKKTLVEGDGWLQGPSEFSELTCSSHPSHQAQATNERCYKDNLVIRVGYSIDGTFHTLYRSCFDVDRLEVLYVWYEQKPYNAINQVNVERPSWLAGSFYPRVSINNLYTQAQQKQAIARAVGVKYADKYISGTQYLARGHLAAKTDFVFASGQRATFYFINAAPQWQANNAGNWNWIEQNLRTRIGDAGYNAVIYTGTFGVTQLRNEHNQLVDIYLHTDNDHKSQIPVPLYYYKVVYDKSLQLGTAFVSINNPYYSKTEVQNLQFCADRCRNNPAFSWLRWQPDRIDIGYSFCCTIQDFRKFVPHLPPFKVIGLLT